MTARKQSEIFVLVALVVVIIYAFFKESKLKKDRILIPIKVIRVSVYKSPYITYEFQLNGKNFEGKQNIESEVYNHVKYYAAARHNLWCLVSYDGSNRHVLTLASEFDYFELSHRDTVGKNIYYFKSSDQFSEPE